MSDENINENILNSYIVLLNTTFEKYTKLKKWNKFPTIEELKNPEILSNIHKKIMISLKILSSKSKEKSNEELNHLFSFAYNLLSLDEEALKKITKLNLLLSTAIISQKIVNEKNEQNYQQLMVEYLQMIMRNFHYAYNNTMYSIYESIANNLAIITHCELIFDYEYVFLYDREYFDKELIPKLKEKMKQVKLFLGEDLIKEFGFENIDFNDYFRIKNFSKFLEIVKDFDEYKSKHTKDEYIKMKEKLKEQFLPAELKLG
jgi:hypothetical protein